MTRRTVVIILIAAVAALGVGTLWYAFFRESPEPPAQSGSFGSGDNRPGTSSGGAPSTNIPSSVGTGQTVGSGGVGGLTSGGTSGSGPLGVSTIVVGAGSTTQQGYGTWLSGGGTGSGFGTGLGNTFTPININDLNDGTISGPIPVLGGGTQPGDDSSINYALLGGGIAVVGCLAGPLLSAIGLTGNTIDTTAVQLAQVQGLKAVPVFDSGISAQLGLQLGYGNLLSTSQTVKENYLDCLTRTIARAALQHITSSVVNWINSGFQGKPSFVTNYKQFFASVADQAAGEYIKGSALSFLCSPFQLKVRIAIAQSYAQRSSAPSCTLSGVMSNLQGFVNNFSQGGWGGLLQFTTVPTNNPFGAYSYAQIGLMNAQNSAVRIGQQDLTLGQGFLSFTQKTGCTTTTDASGKPVQTCTGPDKIVTPGRVIADSLGATQKSSLDSLNLAKSFDEIISALIQQLMVRTLYNGLGNLSGVSGYQNNFLTPDQVEAQKLGNELLVAFQGLVTLAQQYGQVKQSAIQDIQNAQKNLNDLANCWQNAASSTPNLTDEQRAVAASSAQNALAVLHQYDTPIINLNDQITRANTAIATLQELQTKVLQVKSTDDVKAVQAEFDAAIAAGKFVTQNDVTQAQQDRTSLQGQLAIRNNSTQTELQQCNAFGR